MMNTMKRFALVLCLVALCVSLLGVSALAVSYDPVTTTIPVEIALSGYLPEVPDTFKIQVTAEDPTFPMPEGAADGKYVMDMMGNATADFSITFDKHGVYTYTVEQLDIGNEDCYQDTHTYKVVAQVVNNEDFTGFSLIVVVYRDDQNEKREDIIFENRYAMPTEVQVAATKTMDGKTPKDGAFQFELVDADGVAVQTVTNLGSDVIFEPIVCNKIGSTTYTLREVVGSNKKIIYDKTEYTVTVDVTKDDNGDYVGSVSYLKGESALMGTPAFANKTKPIVPNTGENANIMLWGGVMVVALVAIVILLIVMKKKTAKK